MTISYRLVWNCVLITQLFFRVIIDSYNKKKSKNRKAVCYKKNLCVRANFTLQQMSFLILISGGTTLKSPILKQLINKRFMYELFFELQAKGGAVTFKNMFLNFMIYVKKYFSRFLNFCSCQILNF